MQRPNSEIEPLTVLVVEDDEDIRVSLIETLAAEGMHALEAANGAEALALLATAPRPDVILLDLMMPIMDGREFRARQVVDPALAAIPVIVLSANRDAYEQARSLGVADVMQKPLHVDRLVSALHRAANAPPQSREAPLATKPTADEAPPDAATNIRRKTLE